MADQDEQRILRQDQHPLEEENTLPERVSLVHQHTQVSYSGPLPPPATMQGYEDVVPGAAERILAMAEKQLDHRMHLEKVVIEGGSKRADKGIYAAVIVEGMFLATSCYLAHLGLTAAALEVVGGSAVALVGAFGFGTLSRRSERINKKQIETQDEPEENE